MAKDTRGSHVIYVWQIRTHATIRNTTQVLTISHTAAIYNTCRACWEMLISPAVQRYPAGITPLPEASACCALPPSWPTPCIASPVLQALPPLLVELTVLLSQPSFQRASRLLAAGQLRTTTSQRTVGVPRSSRLPCTQILSEMGDRQTGTDGFRLYCTGSGHFSRTGQCLPHSSPTGVGFWATESLVPFLLAVPADELFALKCVIPSRPCSLQCHQWGRFWHPIS